MKSPRPISRRAWAIFLAGMVACGAAIGAAWRLPTQPAGLPPELSRLLAEREELAGATDAERQALRDRWSAVRQRAWAPEQVEQLRAELAARWRWELAPGGRSDRATLHALARGMDEWRHCLATVRALSARPGLIVETLDVRARGGASQRIFTVLSIGVRFVRDEPATGDAERSAPSRSPLPVAGGTGPEPARTVGSVPPLRSGPARPSGPAAGFNNPHPKKETNDNDHP